MSDPINLNRFRQQKARIKKKERADLNSIKFGRSNVEKSAEKAKSDQQTRLLDSHKRDQ